MTEEQIDNWFNEVGNTITEYNRLCKIILEDLQNPATPKIIKDYLSDLRQKCNIQEQGI